jgi:hypothetical protein
MRFLLVVFFVLATAVTGKRFLGVCWSVFGVKFGFFEILKMLEFYRSGFVLSF